MDTNYKDFVLGLLSKPSVSTDALIDRLRELEASGTNPALLICAGLGISGEGGEVSDLVKKYILQGKNVDREQLIKETGDLLFYIQVLLLELEVPFEFVIEKNKEKLSARYPNGFTVQQSEKRKVGDV